MVLLASDNNWTLSRPFPEWLGILDKAAQRPSARCILREPETFLVFFEFRNRSINILLKLQLRLKEGSESSLFCAFISESLKTGHWYIPLLTNEIN